MPAVECPHCGARLFGALVSRCSKCGEEVLILRSGEARAVHRQAEPDGHPDSSGAMPRGMVILMATAFSLLILVFAVVLAYLVIGGMGYSVQIGAACSPWAAVQSLEVDPG